MQAQRQHASCTHKGPKRTVVQIFVWFKNKTKVKRIFTKYVFTIMTTLKVLVPALKHFHALKSVWKQDISGRWCNIVEHVQQHKQALCTRIEWIEHKCGQLRIKSRDEMSELCCTVRERMTFGISFLFFCFPEYYNFVDRKFSRHVSISIGSCSFAVVRDCCSVAPWREEEDTGWQFQRQRQEEIHMQQHMQEKRM